MDNTEMLEDWKNNEAEVFNIPDQYMQRLMQLEDAACSTFVHQYSVDDSSDLISINSDILPSDHEFVSDGMLNELEYHQIQDELTLNLTVQDSYPAPKQPVFSDVVPSEALSVVQQPYQRSKLRYRSEYISEPRRLDCLRHVVKTTDLEGPAISIPPSYCHSSDRYYIRVSLVTVKNSKTNLHYHHPYELEHVKDGAWNDRENNSVLLRIDSKDSIKNFPFLRIVKNKLNKMQKNGNLRVFDYDQDESSSFNFNRTNARNPDFDFFKEYSLNKCQLAFTIAEKIFDNDNSTMKFYTNTTIYSDEMIEKIIKRSNSHTSEKKIPLTANKYVSEYAPEYGSHKGGNKIIAVLRKKMALSKHSKLTVEIQSNVNDVSCKLLIKQVNIKPYVLSFQIPSFPYPIVQPTKVNIILKENKRILDRLKYTYLPFDV